MMNDLLTQIICEARWLDVEDSGWMQILVFVVMAVLYALGSIAKAKKAKTEEGEETAPQLSGESKKGGKPGKRQVTKADLQRTPSAAQRVTIRPVSDRRPKVASVQPAQVQPAPISSPPSLGEVMKLAARTGSEVEIKGAPIPLEVPMPEYLTEILSDYADPEKVRKVILHYEILGKPLSLREPQGNITE